MALLSPFIFIPILTFAFGAEDYDYQSMRDIRRADDHDVAQDAHVDLNLVPGENRDEAAEAAEQAQLQRAAWISRFITVFMTVALLVLWPMPMYGSGYIFSKQFFTGWVCIGILWLFFSAYGCPILLLFALAILRRGGGLLMCFACVGRVWDCIRCGRADTRWPIPPRASIGI